MKTMKPLLKLLFVVLLIGWALSRPMKVKASGTMYACGAGFNQCYANAEQSMGWCTADCTDTGNDGTWVQNCDGLDCVALQSCGFACTYQTCQTGNCFSAPSQDVSCLTTCIDNMNYAVSWCLTQYCTY